MKKNILLSLIGSIVCILPVQLQAAEVLLLDSVIVLNKVDNQAEKIALDYNPDGLLWTQTNYQKDNKQTVWSPDWKSERTYDVNKRETEIIAAAFDKVKNGWSNISKSVTDYDGSNTETITYSNESETWVPVLKTENNDNSLITLSSWQNNKWVFSNKYEMIFNTPDNEMISIFSAWNDTTKMWVQNTFSESTFDGNGKLMVSALYHNYGNQRAIHIEYDEANRLLSESRYQWNDETRDWKENQKNDYRYDAKGRLIETITSRWNQNLNRWTELQKTEYQYSNDDIFPTTATVYAWSTVWVPITDYSYFYSPHQTGDVTDYHPQMQLHIYPNPVGDWFHVSGLVGDAMLNVLGINGKRYIHQNIQEKETISAQSLPKGVYIITIQIGDNIISQKIIKK